MNAYIIVERATRKTAKRYGSRVAKNVYNRRRKRRVKVKSRKNIKRGAPKGVTKYAHASDDVYRAARNRSSSDD